MMDRLAPALFVLSIAVLAVIYGNMAHRFQWFPNPQLELAERTIRDFRTYWRNDLELEPSRHLVEPHSETAAEERGSLRIAGTAQPTEGYVLVAGLSPDQVTSFHAVTLYDSEGEVVHRWPVHYDVIDPDGNKPRNVMLHGMEVFPDGSLALTFDAGQAAARIDACGNPVWITDGHYHHSITSDGTGHLWSWRFEEIERLDADTGEVVQTLSLRDDMMPAAGGQVGILGINTKTDDTSELVYLEDAFHTNDVEALRPEMAEAFADAPGGGFEAGDLLVSMRELNLVAVVDPETGVLKWYMHGPWHRQHDPDFQPDGTITVYDNATHSGRSRIRKVDPRTNTVTDLVGPDFETPFYSWRRGKHQVLPNGNILVTEAERGRIFEASPDGRLIWEREFPWDEERNLIVTEARHLPTDFFGETEPRCTGTADAGGLEEGASSERG